MTERPFLIFPQATAGDRMRAAGGGGKLNKPSAAMQRARLDAKFQQIAASLQQVQATVQGLEPEQVIVFETIGETIHGLAEAAKKVPGLEWLAEMDLDDAAPGDGFAEESDPTKPLSRRLYAVMTNQEAMNSLLSMWGQWCAHPEQRAKPGFGPFKHIFEQLKDLRRWGVQDRLFETQVVEYWQESLALRDATIRFEVELWCRGQESRRRQAYADLQNLVQQAGGQCLREATIEQILYHGVMAELPASAIQEAVDRIRDQSYTQLLRCEDVMFFRPLGQARFAATTKGGQLDSIRTRFADQPQPSGNPVVALLDGLPLENHVALAGRLQIDDPDGLSAHYQPEQQQHGTAMASLVVHGDLNDDGSALTKPIYCRPILVPSVDFQNRVHEQTPTDELIVDLVHRCIRRLKVGDEAIGPGIRIVNLSIGNAFQPFDRELSPLARLLDWLAWEYKILFLVSVGNQQQQISLDLTADQLANLSDDEALTRTLQAMRDDQIFRRQYSPAEAVNVLTVGAIHSDSSTPPQGDRRIDLLREARLPSPISTITSGYKRSVKPEIFFPGGRQLYQAPAGQAAGKWQFRIVDSTNPPGQLISSPSKQAMELDRVIHTRGTSNATALATRCSAMAHYRLHELIAELADVDLPADTEAVVLKALLVHGACWGDAADTIQRLFGQTINDWRDMQRFKARLLGFGEVNPERCWFCTDQRVTMLGWGRISADQGHVYSLPLPPSLSATRIKRRLTITLAWLTPINPRHRDYRKAQLWFDVPEEEFGVAKKDLDADTARRGTVEHRVFEGNRVRTFDDALEVTVNCKENAGALTEEIPYAIAVTLEIAEPTQVVIYDEVRQRIRPRVEIAPATS
ncbi:MAG: S8 family peptidase [Pirellulales bacterium]|nr:S8 family peptidase [Pirellulales bacterium]